MRKITDQQDDGQRYSFYFKRANKPPNKLNKLLQICSKLVDYFGMLLLLMQAFQWYFEWLDPDMLSCANAIKFIAAVVIGVLTFPDRRCPKRIARMGSAKDHMLAVLFQSDNFIWLHLHRRDDDVRFICREDRRNFSKKSIRCMTKRVTCLRLSFASYELHVLLVTSKVDAQKIILSLTQALKDIQNIISVFNILFRQ